jgi:hypothetical protein
MRTDMKREYLTRKKQVTRLQKDAAIDFRNAESSLQEHYATEAADHHPYIRGVDINAPLVSQIQLPNGKHFDVKTFDEHHEFARVRQIHEDLRRDQERDQEQEQRQKQDQEQGQEEEQRWCEAEKEVWNNWVKRQYLQCSPYETRRVVELRNEVQENTEGDMLQLCLEESRHDSDYCGPFGYYPRGEVPRERHEAGLASIRRRSQAEQQQEEEEEQVGRYGDGGFCGCGDLECSDCFSYGNENDDRDSYNSEYDYPREYNYERECREAEEAAAQAAAEAPEQQVMDDDTAYQCDDYPDVVTLTEPKERITIAAAGSTISAKTKAKSKAKAAAAAKARIAKKQQNKFAPITVTINTNRVSVEDAESSSTMLYRGKVQINLPKKNLQNVSRKDKKRHDEKWRRINTEEKQSNARGTRIANIPEPKAWWNSGYSDCE